MRLSFSTPYRQDSIVNIALAAAGNSGLQRFYTTLYFARWQRKAQRVPMVGTWLANNLGRRAFPGIPEARVLNVSMLPELAHVAASRLLSQHRPVLVSDLMYRVKASFDAAVARRLWREPTDALVGMYGASLESFRVIRQQGGLAILNFVNSHPAEHNRCLHELAGLTAPHHELIPEWVVERVEAELELADLVLVQSRFVAEQLLARGISRGKVATLLNGVDLQAFKPPERPDCDNVERPLECLYVGQISHRKGIPVLLEAARRCRGLPIRFRLIGPIVSREVLNGLPDNVIYEGSSLPGRGVAEAMRQADMFVLPTLEDSFARVIFEAMATGLPVITTTQAGSCELIDDGVDGMIVPAGDSSVLAEAVSRLVEQPALRRGLGTAARQKVQGHSWDSYAKSVLTAIEGLRKGQRVAATEATV